MQFKDGTKLRRYVFMQQLLIGIVQALLAVALLTRKNSNDKWIAGVTGSLNFALSIILVSHFGVGIYPNGQPRAKLTIALSSVVNFAALCITLNTNRDEELTSILSFRAEGTSTKALALFFYTTVYITLLLSIGFASYFLINVSDGGSPAKDGRDEADENPRARPADERRNQPVLRDPRQVELGEVCVDNRPRAHREKRNRRHSQTSEASLHMPWGSPNFHNHRQSFRKSSVPRDHPIRHGRPQQRPPTPPPLPPFGVKDFCEQNVKRQARAANLHQEILENLGQRCARTPE